MSYPSDLKGCHVPLCTGAPAFQWTRLADPLEAAEQRHHIALMQGRELTEEEIAARYGPLRAAVAGCVEHHLGDDPADAASGAERRALLHDVDCGGHGACACTGGEP